MTEIGKVGPQPQLDPQKVQVQGGENPVGTIKMTSGGGLRALLVWIAAMV